MRCRSRVRSAECRVQNVALALAAVMFAAVFSWQISRGAVVEAAPMASAQQPQAPATPQPGYAGSEACATCHTGYDASINASKHGQVKNPRSPAAAQGCETCHGPGEAHMNDPEKVKPVQFNRIAADRKSVV